PHKRSSTEVVPSGTTTVSTSPPTFHTITTQVHSPPSVKSALAESTYSFVTVAVMLGSTPSGAHAGVDKGTRLVFSVFSACPSIPRLVSHVKVRGLSCGSTASTVNVTTSPGTGTSDDCSVDTMIGGPGCQSPGRPSSVPASLSWV